MYPCVYHFHQLNLDRPSFQYVFYDGIFRSWPTCIVMVLYSACFDLEIINDVLPLFSVRPSQVRIFEDQTTLGKILWSFYFFSSQERSQT